MFSSPQDLFSQGNVAALGQMFGVENEGLWAKLATVSSLRPAIHRRYAALHAGELECAENEFAFFKFLLLTPLTMMDRVFTTVSCLLYTAEIKASLDGQLLKDIERISGHPGFIRFLFEANVPSIDGIKRAEAVTLDDLENTRDDVFALICAIAPTQVRAHLATAFPYAWDKPGLADSLSEEDRASIVMLFSLAASLEGASEEAA